MEKGTLVEFRLHGARRLGVVERPEGKKHWIVRDAQGQAHTLHPRQVTYTVPDQTYQPQEIPAFWAQVESFLDPEALGVAWELLQGEEGTVDGPAMAQLLFADQTPPCCYAAEYLLSEDKLYFKKKGDRYEPRPASQVRELKHQQEVERHREAQGQEFLATARLALQGQSPDWGQFRGRLEPLEKFATLGEEFPQRQGALEILEALAYPPTTQGAFKLLVDLRLWSPHENLFLRRAQLPVHFPPKVLDVSQLRLASPPPDPDHPRRDLTFLKVYTIDDESTQEIDDGLSVEFLASGGQQLWIHIADPTRWLLPGDPLDLEARRRCTTVYLPTGMVPMFPSELASGPMSLVQGEVCCALSFAIRLDEQGAVQAYEIYPSYIRPTYHLTYEDVDEMLELGITAEPELAALAQWSSRRQTWRQAQGAVFIQMPEASIKVRGDEINIQVLQESPARNLVAEMMILTGEVAGKFGQTRGLPLPFRTQAQPDLPPEQELLQLPAGPVRGSALRRCMPRSEMGTQPARHASLGLDTYTQVTSPIRRYGDLLAHFQIKAHLRQESLPFSGEQMQELIQSLSATTYEATLVERQTNRYWSLEFLRRHPHQVWSALMLRWLREHEGLGLVLFEDLGLELPMRLDRPIYPGDRLGVRAAHVDPRQDMVQLEECPLPASLDMGA